MSTATVFRDDLDLEGCIGNVKKRLHYHFEFI